MNEIHFPEKKFFTSDDLEIVPKGKILYYISVKPTDDEKLLESVRNSLKDYVNQKTVQTNCYSSYENLSKYTDLKIKVEVGEKFNTSGVLNLYLTLNKDVMKDIKFINHVLNVQAFNNGDIKAQISFCLFFDQEHNYLNFTFQ